MTQLLLRFRKDQSIWKKCSKCLGTGEIQVASQDLSAQDIWQECPTCKGDEEVELNLTEEQAKFLHHIKEL